MPLFASGSSGSKRARWLVPLAFLGAFAVFAKVMNTNPPTNSAQTSPDSEEFQTRVYKSSVNEAVQKIAGFALSTYGRGWKLKSQQRVSPDEIKLVFEVPVFLFADILTVSVRGKGEEQVEVNVESHAQIGQGDFGENRRHVRQMLAELDSQLD